jgi:predicted dehydrogenase
MGRNPSAGHCRQEVDAPGPNLFRSTDEKEYALTMRVAAERPGRKSEGSGSRPAIGLGILGCGDLTQQAVLPHLAQPDALPLARVAAICSRTLERAQSVAERYHIPRVTTEYEALLADEAVEAVLILTPARLHFQQALAAVRAGKHVYVQKPLTESLQEALTLEREVQRQGVRAVAAPGQALNPLVPRLREAIKSGAVGAPFWANAPAPGWGGRDIDFTTNPAWYFREGAGPFRDMAVYALHLLIALFGPVRRVCAMQTISAQRRSWNGRPFIVTAPDNVVAQLDFGDGLLASVGAQWCQGGPRAQPFFFGVYGLEGSLECVKTVGAWPTGCDLRRADNESARFELQPEESPLLAGPHAGPSLHVWADLLHLFECIHSRQEPEAGVGPARHVVEILEATARAAETGQTQILETGL